MCVRSGGVLEWGKKEVVLYSIASKLQEMISLRTGLLSVLSSVSLWYLATSANQSSFNLELQQHQHQQEAGLAKDLQVGDSVSRRLVALADLHGDLEVSEAVSDMPKD